MSQRKSYCYSASLNIIRREACAHGEVCKATWGNKNNDNSMFWCHIMFDNLYKIGHMSVTYSEGKPNKIVVGKEERLPYLGYTEFRFCFSDVNGIVRIEFLMLY